MTAKLKTLLACQIIAADRKLIRYLFYRAAIPDTPVSGRRVAGELAVLVDGAASPA